MGSIDGGEVIVFEAHDCGRLVLAEELASGWERTCVAKIRRTGNRGG